VTERERFRLFLRSAAAPSAAPTRLRREPFSISFPGPMLRLGVVFLLIVGLFSMSPKKAYVYLGHCDAAGWRDETFENLPACDGKAGSRTIKALKGMKARDHLPDKTGYGTEIARIREGEKVELRGAVHLLGRDVAWGEVELR
jgi:hypothetical protein